MKSTQVKFALIFLIVGLLSACGTQATESPASAPTEASVPATEAPTNPPADTAPSQPTEAPTTDPNVPAGTVSFVNDVQPILQSRCLNCHGGERVEEGLNMKTYADLMAGSKNGPVIEAGNAENSLLAELVSTQEMPKRGPKLTPPQVQLIIDWVNQGALDN